MGKRKDVAWAGEITQQAMDKSDALEAPVRDADARARERAEARERSRRYGRRKITDLVCRSS